MWADAVHQVPSPCSGQQGDGQGSPKAAWGLHAILLFRRRMAFPWNASEIKKCLFLFRGFTYFWKRTAAPIFIFWLRSGQDFSCCVLFGCCHRHKGSCDRGGVAQTPNVLWFIPASPFLCCTKVRLKYRSARLAHQSPRDMGREWFPFTDSYTTVCCWKHIAAGDFLHFSHWHKRNWQIIFHV